MKGRGQDGFILVAALWVIAALAALASAYALFAARTAPSAALPEERLRAEAAIRAGLELCAFRQLAWPKPTRPDAGAFSAEVGASRVEVAYRSESARIDLNAAPRDMIAGLFARLGLTPAAAGFLADRVVAWRSRPKDDQRQSEAAIYAKNGLAYGPPGAPFDNALEIALLPTVSPALAERALNYVTVFGAAKIDPLVADPLVLSALPGATPDAVRGLLALRQRPRPNPAGLAQAAGALKDFVSVDPNDNIRVNVIVSLGARRIGAEVVLRLSESPSSPYEILYWRDDFDGG